MSVVLLQRGAALALVASIATAALGLLFDAPPEPGGRLVRGIFFGVACGHAVSIAALVSERRFHRVAGGLLVALCVGGFLLCPDITRWVWLPLLPLGFIRISEQPMWKWNPTVWALLAGIPSGLGILVLGDTWVFDPWFDALGSPDRAALLNAFPAIGWLTVGQFTWLAILAASLEERRAAQWALGSLLTWVLIDSTIGITAGGAFNIAVINVPVMSFYLPFLGWRGMRT